MPSLEMVVVRASPSRVKRQLPLLYSSPVTVMMKPSFSSFSSYFVSGEYSTVMALAWL